MPWSHPGHSVLLCTKSQKKVTGAAKVPRLGTVWAFVETKAEEIIVGIFVVVMTVLVFYQVVMRYVFSAPTSWSDEIAVYCMLWSVYLSTSWAVRERAHIRVMNLLPKFMATPMTIFSDLIWFTFAIFLTWQSVLLHLSLWEYPFNSPVLDIAQKWPYLCLVVGFGLMTLRLIQVYYRWIKYGEPLLGDTEHGETIHD
jgi:TRAP-type C4-dicarboxylate transport system permease small subunit